MKKVYLIHGWGGNSKKDWFPWIRKELDSRGFEVIAPDMPNTQKPRIKEWVGELKKIVKPDEDTYFIGHSIGCQAIMRYLEQLQENINVGGAVFVAGWFNLDNLEGEDEKDIAKPWIETSINLEKVKNKAKKFVAFISDNEPYGFVKENSKIFKEKLNAEVIIGKNKRHFTAEDGITEVPGVLAKILEIAHD